MIRRLHKGQGGITGIETAIILIAFVVVASVLAYTVLSAGIFSAEKGKEAIYSGLEGSRGTMKMDGSVIARDTDADDEVEEIVLTVSNALDGEPIDLIETVDSDADGLLSDEDAPTHTCIVTFIGEGQYVRDMAWTAAQVGTGDDDNILESGERFQMTVMLTGLSTALDEYDTFTIEIKPSKGSVLVIERTIPPAVDAVMDLR
ncbi:archaellin/type IV pilin N-terminal domain-containing protein [Chloroflexota bacterium]